MPVRLIPCRHRDTGAETEIPETGLQHLGAYEPIDPEDRTRLGYDKPADTPPADGPAGAQTTPSIPAATPPNGGADSTPATSTPATGAAKKK